MMQRLVQTIQTGNEWLLLPIQTAQVPMIRRHRQTMMYYYYWRGHERNCNCPHSDSVLRRRIYKVLAGPLNSCCSSPLSLLLRNPPPEAARTKTLYDQTSCSYPLHNTARAEHERVGSLETLSTPLELSSANALPRAYRWRFHPVVNIHHW